MLNHRVNIIGVLTLLLLIVIITSCVDTFNDNTLTVGVSGEIPPYSYYDENSNELVGFDVDIANELAKRMDQKLDLKVFSFNRLIPAVLGKQIDFGMCSMNIVKERQKVVNFTIPYNISTGRFVVYKELSDINSIEDIKNSKKPIGIRNGTVYPHILEKDYGFSREQLNIFPTQSDLQIAIQKGAIKIALSDYGAMHHLYKETGLDLKFIGKITETEAGLTVHKKNTRLLNELNKNLQEMIEDGTYDKISRKWFGINPLKETLKE